MKRIAVIGAGGINSWSVKHLNDMGKIFDKKELIYIKIFDNDIIEEKNILRKNQNFTVEDLMQQKAENLAKRYRFDFENTLITKDTIDKLKNFTDVIMGVDNHKTRKLIYKYCLEHKIYLLDLRANATVIMYSILNHDKKWKEYEQLYFSNKDLMERKGGCQREEDITNDHIENGNKIIAMIGIYGIFLKRIRNEKPNTLEWKFAY